MMITLPVALSVLPALLVPLLFVALPGDASGDQLARILASLQKNLLTPIPLCFLLGIICTRIHGGIKIPKELYYSIAIFLLMSIGFIGGPETGPPDPGHRPTSTGTTASRPSGSRRWSRCSSGA